MKIKWCLLLMLSLIILLATPISSCTQPASCEAPAKIYTYPPSDPSANQPSTNVPANTPPTIFQSPELSKDFVERTIVVDNRNNTFSIGVPPGTTEEREIVAQKAMDFWFEYVPDDLKLVVDGNPVERSGHWESKISYKTGVNSFKYTASNPTAQYFSYNLNLIPNKAGESVPVKIRERWLPRGTTK